MPKGYNIDDIRKKYEEIIEIRKRLAEIDRIELNGASQMFDRASKLKVLEEEHNILLSNRKDMINAYKLMQQEAEKNGLKIHKNTHKAFTEQLKKQNEVINQHEKELRVQRKKVETAERYNKVISNTFGIMKKMAITDWMSTNFMKYLIDFDSSVRESARHLGLSAEATGVLRRNFEGAHMMITRMGATSKELYEIQTAYSDETGRAKILTSSMLEDIVKISKSLGISSQYAGSLSGQFELIGYDARATMTYIEGVVDMSERVGVNVNKVIKNLNDNFKRLQTYNFKHGVQGMGQMAVYSEKFRIDMNSMLGVIEKSRNLENIIDMAANLQVLGGQFAAMADPMAMLFEARNDPSAYTKRINEMTRGMIALRKTEEGFSFEMASPMARDMLDNAAKALGLTTEELTKQAFRQREIMELRKQMLGMGVNPQQKDLIENLAKFDTKTGIFTIQVGKEVKAISQLSKNDLELLKLERQGLEQRAINAQTFEDAWKNSMNEFKTILLPMLKGVNRVLEVVRPIFQGVNEWINKLPQFGKDLITGAGVLMASATILSRSFAGVKQFKDFFKLKPKEDDIPKQTTKKRGVKGRNIKSGIGSGLSQMGMGVGIGVAALGISQIASSLENLSEEKVKSLERITWALTTIGATGALTSIVISKIGVATSMSALGMIKFGAGVALVGAGIGIATAGMGYMVKNLGDLIEKGVQSKDSMFDLSKGILSLNAALGTSMLGVTGLPALATTLGVISLSSNKISKVGEAFNSISTVLKSTGSEYEKFKSLLDAINRFDSKKLGSLTSLSEMFKQPLKVEFSDKEINLVSNITLNVDGKKIFEELNLVKRINIRQSEMVSGKMS